MLKKTEVNHTILETKSLMRNAHFSA